MGFCACLNLREMSYLHCVDTGQKCHTTTFCVIMPPRYVSPWVSKLYLKKECHCNVSSGRLLRLTCGPHSMTVQHDAAAAAAARCSLTDLWPWLNIWNSIQWMHGLPPRGASSCVRAYHGSLCFLAHQRTTSACACPWASIHNAS